MNDLSLLSRTKCNDGRIYFDISVLTTDIMGS